MACAASVCGSVNDVVFSEIAEALHLIANGRFRPLGLTIGRMGRLIVPERIVFGHRDFQIIGEGEPNFGAIVSFKDYPARTSPVMFASLRRVPFPVTITNAMHFRQKAEALSAISMRVKQMQSGNDAARSQVLELAQDEDDVMSGRSVYVTHNFSVAVRAASLEDLDRRVAIVQSLLSDAGVTSVRETDRDQAGLLRSNPGQQALVDASRPNEKHQRGGDGGASRCAAGQLAWPLGRAGGDAAHDGRH